MRHCTLCPRACGADRSRSPGRCGAGDTLCVARAAPHMWEEPCLSGSQGSGTVFFTGCPLGCVFCQNHTISHAGLGTNITESQLATLFWHLAAQGVHNLNLVSGSQYYPAILRALATARRGGLQLPVVWNTGGYETETAVNTLGKHIDIWLCDLKFHSPQLSARLAGAPYYFKVASAAARRMLALAGPPRFDADGLLQSGVILRLLVLPGHHRDALEILEWMAKSLPKGGFLLSLMSQYTPPPGLVLKAPFNRRLSTYEYRLVVAAAQELGLTRGYTQARESAQADYTPLFDGTGIY